MRTFAQTSFGCRGASRLPATRACWVLAFAGVALSCALAAAQPGAAPAQDMEQVLQSAPKGVLKVKAVLVSGGKTSPVPGLEANVHLFHDGKLFKQLKVLLDENGAATVPDLPVAMGVVPLVRVEYKGLTYQEAAPAMDAGTREVSVEVKVYESTLEQPAWKIPMRHIIAAASPQGVAVTEMVVVENPSDKTWLGKEADEKGNRPTVELTLPAHAGNVTLEQGFHGWCCTSFDDKGLHIKMPMMPGQARFRFSYIVPVAAAGEELKVTSAAPVESMMFLLPDDGSAIAPVEGADLTPSYAQAGEAGENSPPARIFKCNGLATGQPVGLLISGAPAPAASGAKDNRMLWVWGAAGTLALVAGVLVWRKKYCGLRNADCGISRRTVSNPQSAIHNPQ